MAAATASLDCRLWAADGQTSSCSSSDELPLGLLVMVVAVTGASVVLALPGCAVLSFFTF